MGRKYRNIKEKLCLQARSVGLNGVSIFPGCVCLLISAHHSTSFVSESINNSIPTKRTLCSSRRREGKRRHWSWSCCHHELSQEQGDSFFPSFSCSSSCVSHCHCHTRTSQLPCCSARLFSSICMPCCANTQQSKVRKIKSIEIVNFLGGENKFNSDGSIHRKAQRFCQLINPRKSFLNSSVYCFLSFISCELKTGDRDN